MLTRERLESIETLTDGRKISEIDSAFLDSMKSFALNSEQCQDLDFSLKWCSAVSMYAPSLSGQAQEISSKLLIKLSEIIYCNRAIPPIEVDEIHPAASWNSPRSRPKGVAILHAGPSRKLDLLLARIRLNQDLASKVVLIELDSKWRSRIYATGDGPWYPPVPSLAEEADAAYCREKIPMYRIKSWIDLAETPLISEYAFISLGMPPIPENIVRLIKHGILNPHNGILPLVRGLDSPAWSFMENVPFGLTVHFIDGQLDVGRVVARECVRDGSKDVFNIRIADILYECASNLICHGGIKSEILPIGRYFYRTSLAARELIQTLYERNDQGRRSCC